MAILALAVYLDLPTLQLFDGGIVDLQIICTLTALVVGAWWAWRLLEGTLPAPAAQLAHPRTSTAAMISRSMSVPDPNTFRHRIQSAWHTSRTPA